MLIEIHYGNGSILLVNGNCRSVNFVNYIRKHCCLSSTIPIDLCLLNTGEPLHLLSSQTKIVSADKRRFPFHSHCVLTRIEEDGTYIPLLNDSSLITNDFLTKLKRATTKPIQTKSNTKTTKQQAQKLSIEKPKRRRSLKAVAIVATIVNNFKH